MKIKNHQLTTAQQRTSPNYDDRPSSKTISLLVIHCISLPEGQFNTPFIEQLFTNTLQAHAHPSFKDIYQLKVSSHLVICRHGGITQYVPFHKRAWHAGRSCYQGQENCNDFSIGIELEGSDKTPYTEIQYHQLAQVSNCLFNHYPHLNKQHITGHSDIAPKRKTDPGIYFNWSKLQTLIDFYSHSI